jgi:hypothetical protein
MCRYTDMKERLSKSPLFTLTDAEMILGGAFEELLNEEAELFSATQIIEAAAYSVASIIKFRADELMPNAK